MTKYTYSILLVLILLIGCAKQEVTITRIDKPTTIQEPTPEPSDGVQSPDSTPEPSAEIQSPKPKPKQSSEDIPDEINEILAKSETKLESYSYNYREYGSDLLYKTHVKGNNTKIILPAIINVGDGKFYNTIYLDTDKKTAQGYCEPRSRCSGTFGKIKDLDYTEEHINTPIDWANQITEAEKIGERVVESRDSLYLQTNVGKVILESYYGFIYKVEGSEKTCEFTDVSFNSVKEEAVIPLNSII
jgi:hypothetical protein